VYVTPCPTQGEETSLDDYPLLLIYHIHSYPPDLDPWWWWWWWWWWYVNELLL